MGSEQNDSTSFSPSEPKLCVDGCGFFGTAANMNLCSKCSHDLRVTQEQCASCKAPSFENSPNPKLKTSEITTSVESKSLSTRCSSCSKKVGLMGFKCKCGSTFCGAHRYPENHECELDCKGDGRDAIAKANPVMLAEKVERI